MTDLFDDSASGFTSSAQGALSVTPHDSNELAIVSRGVYVGGVGDLAVVMKDGSEVIFMNAPGGSILPIRAKIIKDTGTTATNILAVY